MRVRTKLEGSDILEMYPKPEPLGPVEVERRYREWREAVSAALGYCLEHEDMTPVWLSEDGEEPAEWRDVA